MRVPVLMARLVLGGALIWAIAPVASPARADSVKCPCDCPDSQKIKARHAEVRRAVPHYAGSPYSYRNAAPIHWPAWRGTSWIVPIYAEPAGLVIDQSGWSGGVGYGAEGGGGGGYGQVLLVNGAAQNGPTYNSFGESFQSNPSMAQPFQNRLMGGLAPRR